MAITIPILILCILSSGFTGNIYKKLSDESQSTAASVVMPSLWFVLLALLFGIIAVATGEEFIPSIIPIALLGGAGFSVAASVLIESMKKVSLSVSVIIINLNFIIPILLSALFLHEPAAPLQLAGMLLSISVIVLLNLTPTTATSEKHKPHRSTILLPLAACMANGLVNFCIKVNENQGGGAMSFFAMVYGSAAVGCLLCSMMIQKKSGTCGFPLTGSVLKATLPYLALMGVCNGVCFYTEHLLAGRMNAAAQFTIVTCASILLSLTVGFLFQGDKFTKKSLVSILFCIIAVLCQYSGIA